MKNKRYIVFFIFVLTLIVSVYQFGRRIQSEKIYFRYLKNIKCEYEKQIEKRNSAYYMLKEDIILNFQNNGLRLCSNEIIYEDGTSACHLKDIISDTSLVVRLSQSNCGICVNTLMSLLQKVNMKNVIFLTDYEDQCFLDDLKLYRIKGRFFKIASLKIPIESMDIPYLFVIDKDSLLSNKKGQFDL